MYKCLFVRYVRRWSWKSLMLCVCVLSLMLWWRRFKGISVCWLTLSRSLRDLRKILNLNMS